MDVRQARCKKAKYIVEWLHQLVIPELKKPFTRILFYPLQHPVVERE
jgi:hypothetical protein